jgi:hypothetical protein
MANSNPKEGFDNSSDVLSDPVGALGKNLTTYATSILSVKPTAKYASGARCILKINGRLCGFAFAVSWRITTQVTEINTIDDPTPYELAPQRIAVDGTISALHIPGQGVGVRLWQPDMLNFLTQQYITIEVRDSATDQLLFFTNKAMITTRAEDIRTEALANVQLTWKAIGFKDEREPKPAEDGISSIAEALKNKPESINDFNKLKFSNLA